MIEIIKNSKGEDVYQDPVDKKWYKVRPEKIIKNSKQEDVTQVSNGEWHKVSGVGPKTSVVGVVKELAPKLAQHTIRTFLETGANIAKTATTRAVEPGPIASPDMRADIAPRPGQMRDVTAELKPVPKTISPFTPKIETKTPEMIQKAAEFWQPSEQETNDIAKAGIPEKVAYGVAGFIGQWPYFEVAGAAGHAAIGQLAKTLGVTDNVIINSIPAIAKKLGTQKALSIAKSIPANFAGFTGLSLAEGKPIGEAAQSGAFMAALPLNRMFPKAFQPLTGAAAGFLPTYAGTGDIKEATAQGLLFAALEAKGLFAKMPRAEQKIIERANENPTPENVKLAAEAVTYIVKSEVPKEELAQLDEFADKLDVYSPEERQSVMSSFNGRAQKVAEKIAQRFDEQKGKTVQAQTEARQAETIARTDKLTNIGNRLAWDEAYSASQQTGDKATVQFDIDKFKKFNDTYGHKTGDAVLKTVAQKLDEVAKQYGGQAFRYGGEEMTALVPKENAKAYAEAARQVIESTDVNGLNVTVSAGIGDNYEMADKALYHSKQTGRNRVSTIDDIDTKVKEIAPDIEKPAVVERPAAQPEAVRATEGKNPYAIGKVKILDKYDIGSRNPSTGKWEADWDNAEICSIGGEKIVHVFEIKDANGKILKVGKEHLQQAMSDMVGSRLLKGEIDKIDAHFAKQRAGAARIEWEQKYIDRGKDLTDQEYIDLVNNVIDKDKRNIWLSEITDSKKAQVIALADAKATSFGKVVAKEVAKETMQDLTSPTPPAETAKPDLAPTHKRETVENIGQELYAGLPLNPFKIAMEMDKAWRGTKAFQITEKALFEGGGNKDIPPEWWNFKPIQKFAPVAKALTPQYGISDQGKIAIDNYKAWLNENTDRIKTNIDKLKKLKPDEMRDFRDIVEYGIYDKDMRDAGLAKLQREKPSNYAKIKALIDNKALSDKFYGLAKENQDISTDLYRQAVDLHLAGPSSFEGIYFPHIYKVLEGKKLTSLEKKTVAKIIKLQGQPDKSSKVNEMMATGKFTNDELGALAKDFQAITKGGTTPNIIAGRTGVKIGPQHYAKQRQLADEQVQGLLQLIDDSPAPIAKRMVELTRDVAATRFLREIANTPTESIDATAISLAKEIRGKMGDKYQEGLPLEEYAKTDVNIPKERQANVMTYLSTGEFPDIPEGYSLVEGKKYGPLNGFAVNDNLLEQEIKPMVEAPAKVDRILRKMTSTYKFLKVPANIPTSARNLYSNVFASWMLGGVDPTDYALQRRAIQSIKNKDEHYKNMLKYDLVGTQWAAQELGQLDAELTGGNPVEKVISKLGGAYSKSEEIFKAITYINGIEQGLEPKDAAYMASYAVGNYAKIPPLIKQLRSGAAQGPLGAAGPIVQSPFLTWKYLFVGRFMTSLLRRPFSNLLVAATAYSLYMGLKRGLEDVLREKFGRESGKEADKLILSGMKYWARHGKIVVPVPGVRFDKNGEPIADYLDLTFLSPFGDFAELVTRLEEGNVQKAVMESIGMGGNPILNLMNLYRTGRNEFLDRDIYDKLDNPAQVQKKLFQEAFRQVAPSMLSYGIPNMINAIKGRPGGLGEQRSLGREAASMFGIKTVPYQATLKQREAIKDLKTLQKDFMLRRWKLVRNGASQKEIDDLTKDFGNKVNEIRSR